MGVFPTDAVSNAIVVHSVFPLDMTRLCSRVVRSPPIHPIRCSAAPADVCGREGTLPVTHRAHSQAVHLGRVLQQRSPSKAIPHGKKYHIHTFGCQMNLADSERMAGVLDEAGFQNVVDPDAADVLIYNTCSIREKAEEKVYSAMGTQVTSLLDFTQPLRSAAPGQEKAPVHARFENCGGWMHGQASRRGPSAASP